MPEKQLLDWMMSDKSVVATIGMNEVRNMPPFFDNSDIDFMATNSSPFEVPSMPEGYFNVDDEVSFLFTSANGSDSTSFPDLESSANSIRAPRAICTCPVNKLKWMDTQEPHASPYIGDLPPREHAKHMNVDEHEMMMMTKPAGSPEWLSLPPTPSPLPIHPGTYGSDTYFKREKHDARMPTPPTDMSSSVTTEVVGNIDDIDNELAMLIHEQESEKFNDLPSLAAIDKVWETARSVRTRKKAPTRARNSFILFRQYHTARLREVVVKWMPKSYEERRLFRIVAKVLSLLWRSSPKSVVDHFVQLSRKAKKDHESTVLAAAHADHDHRQ